MKKRIVGPGAIRHLPSLLGQMRFSKILLVHSKTAIRNESISQMLEEMSSRLIVSRFSDFTPNPKLDDLMRGIESARECQPDAIVALGGGSVIDMAKLLAALMANVDHPIFLPLRNKTIKQMHSYLIAVPTTGGSGAEETPFAVIYVNGIKHSVENQNILPDLVILDSELLESNDAHLTAVSGIDAIAHSIESLWSIRATPKSSAYAIYALKLAWANIVLAVNSPTLEIRTRMLLAANIAGRAIAISKTTAPHALSYYFTIQHAIPHGHAVALSLGRFLSLTWTQLGTSRCNQESKSSIRRMLRRIYDVIGAPDHEGAEACFYQRLKDLNLEWRLDRLGIAINEIDEMAVLANEERLRNHPFPVTPSVMSTAFHWI